MFSCITPAISDIADIHKQSDPAQRISTHSAQPVKMNDNPYFCLFAFDIFAFL